MPVPQPSQFQIDKMEQGDIIFVKKQKLLYRLYRKFFLNMPKVKVKKFWSASCDEYNTYYQEDCTLLYRFELQCVQKYNHEVAVIIGADDGKKVIKTSLLKELQVGLYNIMLSFDNGLCITVPLGPINDAIRKNQKLIQQDNDYRIIQEMMKYQTHKGDYFSKYAKEHKIDSWIPAYCSVCGEPAIFHFEDDKVIIENKCSCGEMKIEKTELNYDEFSIWYYNQTNDTIKKRYKEFWFKKE